MKPWKVAVASLAVLACAWAPSLARAAEPAGPVTLAAANSCPAPATPGAAAALAPLPFLPQASPADAATPACGPCSQAVCVGKPLNSFCFGFIRLCQKVSLCPTSAALTPHCECLSPP
jgi:hypothetical protein